MKIILTLGFILNTLALLAQSCPEKILSKDQKSSVHEYVQMAQRNHWFLHDWYGVITITIQKKDVLLQRQSNTDIDIWQFNMKYLHDFESGRPTDYLKYNDILVLMYDERKPKNLNANIPCLDSLLDDRLLIRPALQERKFILRDGAFADNKTFIDSAKKPIARPIRPILKDNQEQYMHFGFNKDSLRVEKSRVPILFKKD